jgi:hypothetical protein
MYRSSIEFGLAVFVGGILNGFGLLKKANEILLVIQDAYRV